LRITRDKKDTHTGRKTIWNGILDSKNALKLHPREGEHIQHNTLSRITSLHGSCRNVRTNISHAFSERACRQLPQRQSEHSHAFSKPGINLILNTENSESPLLESLEFTSIMGDEHIIVRPFLAKYSSQMLCRIVLRNGVMSAGFFKKTFVHFKQLQSLELSDFLSDFTAWEVLGTLPSLANLTLTAIDPALASGWHHAHATENSNSQTRSHIGGTKYFDALESLSVTGSFPFIQHLLSFIDSPCLTTIKVYSNSGLIEHEFDFTPSMTIIASRWSQSLKNLVIDSSPKWHPGRAMRLCNIEMLDIINGSPRDADIPPNLEDEKYGR
jgi:hypothetical protein